MCIEFFFLHTLVLILLSRDIVDTVNNTVDIVTYLLTYFTYFTHVTYVCVGRKIKYTHIMHTMNLVTITNSFFKRCILLYTSKLFLIY